MLACDEAGVGATASLGSRNSVLLAEKATAGQLAYIGLAEVCAESLQPGWQLDWCSILPFLHLLLCCVMAMLNSPNFILKLD